MTDIDPESVERFPGYVPGTSYIGDTVAGGFIIDPEAAPDPEGLAKAVVEILDRGLGNPRSETGPSPGQPTQST